MPATKISQRFILVVCGLLLAILLLEGTLRFCGWIILQGQETRNRQSLRRGGIRILCLGESTTALPLQHAYPQILQKILNHDSPAASYSVINKGISGVTTADILKDLAKNLDKYKPHIVITMMGVNDQFRMGADAGRVPTYHPLAEWRLYKVAKYLLSALSPRPKESRSAYDQVRGPVSQSSQRLLAEGLRRIERKDYKQAEDFFHRSWEADRRNYRAVMEWAGLLEALGRIDEAELVFLRFLDIFPRHVEAQHDLAEFYETHQRWQDLERVLQNRVAHQAFDPQAVEKLAGFYFQAGQAAKANDFLQESHRIPERRVAERLEEFYRRTADGRKVFELFRQQYKDDPMAHRYLGLAGVYFLERKRPDLAQWYLDEARRIRALRLHPSTVENYRRVRDMLQRRGIRHGVMQYPLRTTQEIKEFLGEDRNIFYIDNDRVFRRALEEQPYDALFWDRFAGDFGHATPEGNRLIAENAARSILQLE